MLVLQSIGLATVKKSQNDSNRINIKSHFSDYSILFITKYKKGLEFFLAT